MSLYDGWLEIAQRERSKADHDRFWQGYFDEEEKFYDRLLTRRETTFSGTIGELAKEFGASAEMFMGFLDGIDTSLKASNNLETAEADTQVSLPIDYEKLYFNMLNAKADWLIAMPQWEDILPLEERKRITKEFRASKIFTSEETIGRNDPCPCGSGKKYKKCCGADK